MRGASQIKAVGLATTLPLNGGWANPVSTDPSQESSLAGIRPISGDYFGAMGTPLSMGRVLSDADTETSEAAVVINETAARKLFAGDPIGQHLKLGQPGSRDEWRTVVGVVADIKERGLDSGPDPDVYIPYYQLGDVATQMAGRGLYLIMRSDGVTLPFACRSR